MHFCTCIAAVPRHVELRFDLELPLSRAGEVERVVVWQQEWCEPCSCLQQE